ncbi:serine/threonine-protein kinase [Archangium sp.]|uniref:serine/threonine protein kinase n=1 Tax=Archangium sp. TaxID=1872627 RepID=UPI00286AD628|nr:serine/threonine-protein kinase [Archangium sp.]
MNEATSLLRPEALPPGTEIGHWRVAEKLAVGGYGAVYEVEDLQHPNAKLPLALKLALRPGDPRAEREVVLLVEKAVHPNVVRFHGCGRWPHPTEGHTYHVMELVPGQPMDLWAETLNPSFLRFAETGAKLARALGELHARGVFHRDVKPENILIRETDGEPVLVDFGVGDYVGAAPLTSTPLPPGTTHLRTPEAMRFWLQQGPHSSERYEVGAADDLYALGVSLYRAVTGHYPFPPELQPDLLGIRIATRRAHVPRDFNRRIPRALSDVLVRMLAKEPGERYRDGLEVHDALMAAAAFGGHAQWEASLFEWEEEPAAREGEAPQRRIRRPAPPTRPVTPAAPRVRLLPVALSPERLQRGPQAEAPVPSSDGRQERGVVLPRGPRAVALGLGLVLVLPGLWLLAHRSSSPRTAPEPAPPSLPSPLPSGGDEVARAPELSDAGLATTPLPSESTPRAMKGTPLKKPQQTTRDPSAQQESGSLGKALGTAAACVGLACASAQVRPPATTDCPAESLAVMKQLGLYLKQGPTVRTDIHQDENTRPAEDPTSTLVRSGPIISRTLHKEGQLPAGTLVFGELFTGGTNVYGRYDRVQTPDGETYPVCFILGTAKAYGVRKRPSLQPGAFLVSYGIPLTAVKRFVFKEPPKPGEEEEE